MRAQHSASFCFIPPDSLPAFRSLEGFDLHVDVFDKVVVLADGGIEYRSEELQVFFHRKILIQREPAGHVADTPAYLFVCDTEEAQSATNKGSGKKTCTL